MGIVFSLLSQIRVVVESFHELQRRLALPPGLPWPNPPLSYWIRSTDLPPYVPPDLPEHADVVIIGSGITGAAISRTLLSYHEEFPLKIVVIDARDTCGGATGRNGGHAKPYLYEEYGDLKERFGVSEAQKIIRFRQANLPELIQVATDEGVLESTGCRVVESLDVFMDSEMFEDYKERLATWVQEMPKEAQGFHVVDPIGAPEKFHLSSNCRGIIASYAGALHPYRLVNAIFKRLRTEYPEHFFLCSRTSCTTITPPSHATPFYSLSTSAGTITTPHVIHATNAYCSNLLPRMRGKIIPGRASVSAQRPGRASSESTLGGRRSWMFYYKNGYDYLTQVPTGELIFGGGFIHHENGLGEVALTNDSEVNFDIASYLGGALPTLFGDRNWGPELVDETSDEKWSPGRVKAIWSGIESISADGIPWVGPIPRQIASRLPPPLSSAPAFASTDKGSMPVQTAAPCEWIAAGYSGDGMSSAYLSGKALAMMLLGKEHEGDLATWFPDSFRVSRKRWSKANPEKLLAVASKGLL